MTSQFFRQQLMSSNLRVLKGLAAPDSESSHLPLALKVLIVGEALPFPLFLKVRREESPEIHFLPYLEAGEGVDASFLEPLERLGLERGYFRAEDLETVIAYLNNHLLLTGNGEGKAMLSLCREHLGLTLRLALRQPHLGKHLNAAKKVLGQTLQVLERDDLSFRLLGEILFSDYSLYTHSVNVSLLSMAMPVFLGKGRRESLTLGLAGLFHDVGLTRVDASILCKVEPLGPEDWADIREHPALGHRLLSSHPHFPVAALRLVLEHHENADGSGYPQGLTLAKQHPLTRVLRLLDAYDALTSHRPYRPALRPFAALKVLQEQLGPRGATPYAPQTLKDLIRFLAII
ncbi:MAG: HD domain-containing protein [Deltaproteobacteria bacterium]|nr:HD domain-containing protein [Deltaproteobacteria bacterium]